MLKVFRDFLILASVFLCGATAACAAQEPSAHSFAVVELFTSEGCSSCPPADEIFNEVTAIVAKKKQHVYPLAFHVDYWDSLGWKDPFSQGDFTQRQRAYASALNLQGVYTPQMIVNGKTAFVASRRELVKDSVNQALGQPAVFQLALSGSVRPDLHLKIKYAARGDFSKPRELHLALVERGLVSEVGAGENAGRTLAHDNVVRIFKSIKLLAHSGEEELVPPPGVDLRHCKVIGFIQDPDTMVIEAASQLNFYTAQGSPS